MLLAAQFQGFCRGLHSQAAVAIAQGAVDRGLSVVIQELFTRGRRLDQGNASLATLGADFGRFGFDFWNAVEQAGRHNARRKEELHKLMKWRNAIAHDDIARRLADLDPKVVTLRVCTGWHRRLDGLVVAIDGAVADQCENLGRPRPW
jgi:hypothetical protein